MSSDISFGDVEETPLKRERRPDQNRRFAVAGCYAPHDEDLAIFVDLDALLDMELHAQTDTSVELGGVMLGGQFEDDEGRPFVVVTDNLRAAHYEATKGSFKFTHDTWQQISRERDEFPAELQMVGWYHTHPDWGVFLSGMDTFICDHFFNRPLDLALVIDPCRLDRGWFQWTSGGAASLRRTGGFYIFTSRYRSEELAVVAAQLEGQVPMRVTPTVTGAASGSGAPVVNIHEDKQAWIGSAVVGILAVQCCLILFGLFVFAGGGWGDSRLGDLEKKVRDLETREAVVAAKSQAIDELIGGLKGGGTEHASKLLGEARTRVAHLEAEVVGVKKLNDDLKDLTREFDLKKDDLAKMEKGRNEYKSLYESKDRELKAAQKKIEDLGGGATDVAGLLQNPYVLAGLAAGGILIAGIAAAFLSYRPANVERSSPGGTKSEPVEMAEDSPTVIDDTTARPPKSA